MSSCKKTLFTLFMLFLSGAAFAGAFPGIWLTKGVTPVKQQIYDFHNLLMVIMTAVVVLVFALLLFAMIRFNRKANPIPSKTTHNVMLEIIWTVVPVLILFAIAVPSFSMLYSMDRTTDPEMALKITGYQWYWGYEYPDQEIEEFTAIMIPDEEIKDHQVRLLSTDNVVVLPVDTNIQLLVASADVLHAWAMPEFGVKKDAVPGRLNESWARIEQAGVYYGQCSELCGKRHGFMPIEVHAVSKKNFSLWVTKAREDIEAATIFVRNL